MLIPRCRNLILALTQVLKNAFKVELLRDLGWLFQLLSIISYYGSAYYGLAFYYPTYIVAPPIMAPHIFASRIMSPHFMAPHIMAPGITAPHLMAPYIMSLRIMASHLHCMAPRIMIPHKWPHMLWSHMLWLLCSQINGFHCKISWLSAVVNNLNLRDVERELFPCLRRLGMRFYAYNPVRSRTGWYQFTHGMVNGEWRVV